MFVAGSLLRTPLGAAYTAPHSPGWTNFCKRERKRDGKKWNVGGKAWKEREEAKGRLEKTPLRTALNTANVPI